MNYFALIPSLIHNRKILCICSIYTHSLKAEQKCSEAIIQAQGNNLLVNVTMITLT